MSTDKNLLRRMWNSVLENLNLNIAAESERVERAIGMSRLYEQLWEALGNSEQAAAGWAYPLDIFVGDDGSSLFSIVAQNGKLFQIPLTVSQENLTLGEWTQVTEVFQPIIQSQFSITRQKDGRHRWLCIAATTVLNRIGQMDSSELFDSFIRQAEKSNKYPRLDFYHLGETDPKTWEFGTADYLAREGVCYIASGLFDEDHPLAKAMIRVCENGSDEWGNSIEFYAFKEPEIIVLDPEIQVPVYREGENIRISVVLEKDAACLFTRMIEISEEKVRTMDPRTEEALKKIFEGDEEAIKAFIENVDTVNRTVKNDKLIHRKKKDEPVAEDPEDDENAEDTDSDEDDEQEDEPGNLVLDELALAYLAQQLATNASFTTLLEPISQSISDLSATVAELTTGREADRKEISRLKKLNSKLVEKVDALSVDDTTKKQEYLQDLPARRHTQATYRPRDAHKDEDEDDSETIAQRTLATLPKY